jgi:hypothetical protein
MSGPFKQRGVLGESCSVQRGSRQGKVASIGPDNDRPDGRVRRSAIQNSSSPKTEAERKREQRDRDRLLEEAGLVRLKVFLPEIELGDLLRRRGIELWEDGPEPLARGVEKLFRHLLDESRDGS